MPRQTIPDLTAGETFSAAVLVAYDLDPAERAVLAEAARTIDELVRIDDALRTAELMVEGSMGQPVPNPLLAEARQHRKVLESLARSLALPLWGEHTGTVRHPQQRQAGKARHSGPRLSVARKAAGDGDA